jgi:hypothetical protein
VVQSDKYQQDRIPFCRNLRRTGTIIERHEPETGRTPRP